MRSRLETLRRLASLYGSIESLQSAELQRRSAAVQEAEQSIGFQQAVVRALVGEIDIVGKLPISLPGLYPRGTGIQVAKIK